MSADFSVRAAAGSLRSRVRADAVLPHKWSDQGVAVQLQFTGGHLLHLAAAGCILNDLFREAAKSGVELEGALVIAEGGFDEAWQSTGITYRVELDSPAAPADQERLLHIVDEVAEIPKALRIGASVVRVE